MNGNKETGGWEIGIIGKDSDGGYLLKPDRWRLNYSIKKGPRKNNKNRKKYNEKEKIKRNIKGRKWKGKEKDEENQKEKNKTKVWRTPEKYTHKNVESESSA